jgi:class 3 adenylate cyclase
MTASSSDPAVVMFMSVDVVGSTNYKVQAQRDGSDWLEAFATLFRELPLIFIGEVAAAFMDYDDVPDSGVWKVMGDEVILVALPSALHEAAALASAFCRTVASYDRRLAGRWPLRIRGACWAATLGRRNRMIEIPEMFGGSDGRPYRDFLGPDVDTGFRLSAHAGHGEVIMSPNLVEALACTDLHPELAFHPAGEASLKGVIDGQPFPLWMVSADGHNPLDRPVAERAKVAAHLAGFRRRLVEELGIGVAEPVL